jgi:uncharacterized protein YndB with AHSA1/START domain
VSGEALTAAASTRVAAPPDRAFAAFADLGAWWPREFSWSGDVLDRIELASGEGGLASEYGPHGFRCDWGRVLAWEPPRRLVLAWQIGPTRAPEPDPARASEVEVRFEPGDRDGTTRVSVGHRGFERHGDGAAEYAANMGPGWAHILDRFAAALDG